MHSSPEKQACLRSEDPDSRIFEVETVPTRFGPRNTQLKQGVNEKAFQSAVALLGDMRGFKLFACGCRDMELASVSISFSHMRWSGRLFAFWRKSRILTGMFHRRPKQGVNEGGAITHPFFWFFSGAADSRKAKRPARETVETVKGPRFGGHTQLKVRAGLAMGVNERTRGFLNRP